MWVVLDGATENWVWEGVGALATLAVGLHTVRLTGVNTTTDGTADPAVLEFAERSLQQLFFLCLSLRFHSTDCLLSLPFRSLTKLLRS